MPKHDTKEEKIQAVTGQEMLPVVPLRGIVAFPHMVLDFEIGREASKKAVDAAIGADRRILLLTQREQIVTEPAAGDLHRIGVICEVRQVLRGSTSTRVLVEGIRRAKVTKLFPPDDAAYWRCDYKPLANYSRSRATDEEMQAIINSVRSEFAARCRLQTGLPREFIEMLLSEEDPQLLFEGIWSNVEMNYHDRQMMLEEGSLFLRLTMLFAILRRENEILRIEQDIQNDVQSRIEQGQKEMFLREQLHAIREELGETDPVGDSSEPQQYIERIEALPASDEVKEKLLKEANQLMKMPAGSQEAYVIGNYLDTVLSLPWGVYTEEKSDILKAAAQLDKDHYGLKRVKERVLESMSVHMLKPELTGQIICLVGPPGVGKTSIAKSVAKALGRNYVRISLGGVRDEAEIRGHRKTYVGAMAGRIIEAMRQAKSSNPLILLDEIDKLSGDFKGDPAAALLEVLDSAQNHAFRDHFIEVPFDLSRVLFLTTANDPATIPAPLYDRMDVIELNSYTREEKFHIAKEHLIKKQIRENGLKATQIRITDAAIYDLIDYYTKEAGVRTLERQIASLCRKCAKALLSEVNIKRVTYTPETVEAALGPHKFSRDYFATEDTVGLVNGLAWTSVGGVLMPLEVLMLPGKGEIQVTGSLGDVMKESAKLAISYARFAAKQYGINLELFKTKDIHIHAPEGAVPKDGPSAGVTMLTALISALSGIPVRHDIAMTGEITLHGKVLPIGGLVEKSMAAYKNGIRTVLIPAANVPDLAELDADVRDAIRFIPCEHVDTVLETALIPPKYDVTKLEPLHEDDLQKLILPPIHDAPPRARRKQKPAT